MLLAWVVTMGVAGQPLVSPGIVASLATDLARYGSTAQWRGVYYRGEKIGFTVSQTVPTDDGFELEEDGRLQMSLLGATTAATIRTTAHVDTSFALRSFEFSLDPGHRADRSARPIDGRRLTLDVKTAARHAHRSARADGTAGAVAEPVAPAGQRRPGAGHAPPVDVFDPATLRNAPVTVDVGKRELVRGGGDADSGVPRRDDVHRPARRRRGSPTPARSSARRARSG